jgi:hypothetical protein
MGAADKRSGGTHAVEEGVGVRPRLPHEHDESSDSQDTGVARPEIRQAHDDVASGVVDTDKGKPLDEAYQRQKTAKDPAPPKGR